jgi:Spy/CpxP family protein refolding chaperone
MKKFLLPLLALALSATAASAQAGPGQDGGRPRRTPEEMAARQTEGLTKQLGLSADQAAKVQQIMLARDQEMLAMRGQLQAGSADRQQLRDQMLAGRTKYDDQLKAVLTPDQYTTYTAMQANRR